MTVDHQLRQLTDSSASSSDTIVIINGDIVWKHGSNRPFFLYNLSFENY